MSPNPKLAALVQQVRRLPTLPTIYSHVTELMNDPHSSCSDIGDVVSRDQAIASKLLRVVNSSFYGLRQRVTNITRAMTVVGFRGLKGILLTLTVLPMLKAREDGGGFAHQSFWSHALACGAAARALGRILQLPEPEELFAAGLLHDVGKVAEYWFLTDTYIAMSRRARDTNQPIAVIEQETLGFTHAEVGYLLAQKWLFPDRLAEAIGCHHTLAVSGAHMRETALVHLADILARARMVGVMPDPRVPPLNEAAWQATGLKTEQLEQTMNFMDEELERGEAFLAIVQEA